MSGGSANFNIDNSTGGGISTHASGKITSDTMNNLWSNVSGPDATTGSTKYRCFYIKNANGTTALTGCKVWISSPTASPNDEVDISQDTTAGPGSNTTASSNGTTDPGSASWRRPLSETDSNVITFTGSLGPGQQQAMWVKRTVQAGAAAFASNVYEISISGETT